MVAKGKIQIYQKGIDEDIHEKETHNTIFNRTDKEKYTVCQLN